MPSIHTQLESSGKNRIKTGIPYRSRIFWRIAGGIFASILLIEALLLLYSWFTERNRMLARQEQSLVQLVNMLDASKPIPELNRIIASDDLGSEFRISGIEYVSSKGEITTLGDADSTAWSFNPESGNSYDRVSETYISRHTRQFENGASDSLTFVVDTQWLTGYMTEYVWRILGMVMLISIFVTIACLFILKPLLVDPLRRLDKLLVFRDNKRHVESIAKKHDLKRSDELGSVFRSFVEFQNKITSAENKNLVISERFKEFANMGADCFWELDSSGKFSYAVGDFERILSSNKTNLEGTSLRSLMRELKSRVPGYEKLLSALKSEGQWEGQIFGSTPNSDSVYVRVQARPVFNDDGQFVASRGTIVDVTREMELSHKLEYQAFHDELTDLYNRRSMNDSVQQCVDAYELHGEICSLIMLDLDNFKPINDNCGHIAGDSMLVSVADTLKAAARPGDTVLRHGGDEFAIVMPDTQIDDALPIAEKILQGIAGLNLVWEQKTYSISASVGIAEIFDAIANSEALIFAADNSCIDAKRSGKNRIVVHTEHNRCYAADEAGWITRIMHALEADKFSLFRQSIVRINSSDYGQHFEILLRMIDPDGGFYSPADFLPVAERNNLMPLIDRWVLDNAIAWLSTQDIDSSGDYCMNINISATSLGDSDYCSYLIEKVKQLPGLTRYICFEITETAAMSDFQQTVDLLSRLREYGCSVALDDFGTGFSSLSHIRELPLDYIKIDGSFIQEITNNQLDQTVVKSVAEIAKVLRIKTVAEFVDSEEALQVLENLHIDYAQGFFFSKPEQLPVSDNVVHDSSTKAA